MKHLILFFMAFCGMAGTHAQTTIIGSVKSTSGEALTGANVVLKGTGIGTIADFDGKFILSVDEIPPFTLVISFIGYQSQEIEITGTASNLNIQLESGSSFLQEVVVSASRVEEKILESPVTIEKLDLQTIKAAGSADYFDQMTKLKGVTGASGSLTFNAINTRGFGGIANTRFVQLVDGIDNSAPLLNFPLGNLIGIGENDIKDVELVPGAASALYGPNAFNGIMIMNSKNPFDYEGLTGSVKGGFTMADNDDSHPLYNADFRFAKTWGKWGFKITGSYFGATDWKADDYYTDIVTQKSYDGNPANMPLNFNGVNRYGDENILSTVPLGALPPEHPTRIALIDAVAPALAQGAGLDLNLVKGLMGSFFPYLPAVNIRRTGLKEEDLLDTRKATSAKGALALHYRPTQDIDINYAFRIGSGNSIYQGQDKYALRNFLSYSNKIEATGKNFMVRSYMTQTDAGDSYHLTALGSYTNELMAGTATAWAPTYLGTYVGAYMQKAGENLLAGSPIPVETIFQDPNLYLAANLAARQAADKLLPQPGSSEFQNALNTIKGTYFQRADLSRGILGGASFIDHSRLFHTEGTYDLSSLTDNKLGILVGANHRLYSLFTDGTIFNEDPAGTGTNSRINNNEFGAFAQLTKRLADERLRISASLRYDKNENFKGIVSPRLALVGTMGAQRQHNIRASYQTGFRNPDTQAQYIYFPAGAIIMGGSKANAERYGIYNGGAYSFDSFNTFLASALTGSPNPALLKEVNMDYIGPEKLSSVELGYKSVIKNLFVDWNVYYTWYKDFISGAEVIAKQGFSQKGAIVPGFSEFSSAGTTPALIRAYSNVSDQVTSWGTALGLNYSLGKGYFLNANYNYMDFDAPSEDKKNIDFNSPPHIINFGLANSRVGKSNFGFSVSYRWQDEFYWASTFGRGIVDAYSILDASVAYNIRSANTTIRLGGTNLAGPSYITNIGGPTVGRTVFLGVTYDGSVTRSSR